MAAEKKSYGLIIKKKPALDVLLNKNPSGTTKAGVFSLEDDGESFGGAEKFQTKVRKQDSAIRLKAMAEDPTVFQYDEIYDEMSEKKKDGKTEEHRKADKDRKPKYIHNLIKTATIRELEFHAREERAQHKEREKEAGEFDDKESFVTGAYRRKLEELESYKEEERQKALFESRLDVTKQKDISGFYKHLLDVKGEYSGSKDTSSALPVKTEPEEELEIKQEISQESSKATVSSSAKKERVYRKRKFQIKQEDDDSDNETSKTTPKEDSTRKKTIYSSDEEEFPVEDQPEAPPRPGLTLMAGRNRSRDAITVAEKQRQRFTPSPPPESRRRHRSSSPSKDKDREKKKRSSPSRKRSPRRSSDEAERKKPEPKETDKERLERIFGRKTSKEALEEYRRRYFERRASNAIIPPTPS